MDQSIFVSMFIYFGVFILGSILSIFDISILPLKYKKNILCIGAFCLSFFVGGRYWCDNDFESYVAIFNAIPPIIQSNLYDLFEISLSNQVEFSYILFCSILQSIGLGYQSMFLFYSIITFVIISKVFLKISSFPITSFFLYFTCFFSLPFMQMRFGVAMVVVFYALLQLDLGRKKDFWLWMLVAMLFHIVSIVGFLVYFIYKFRITRKRSFIIMVVAFLGIFVPIKSFFLYIITSVGLHRYMAYMDTERTSLVSVVYLIILLIPFVYYDSILRNRLKQYHLLLAMALSTILIGCMTSEIPILNRFYLLLSVSYCVILPSYIFLLKKQTFNILFYWVILLAYSFMKFLPHLNHIQPYRNFLFSSTL